MKTICKLTLIALLLLGCAWSIRTLYLEATTPTEEEKIRHVADTICDSMRNCPAMHTIVAQFPDGRTATVDLPPWNVMIIMSDDQENPADPEMVVRKFIRDLIVEAQEAGAVGFGVYHTEGSGEYKNPELTPDRRA